MRILVFTIVLNLCALNVFADVRSSPPELSENIAEAMEYWDNYMIRIIFWSGTKVSNVSYICLGGEDSNQECVCRGPILRNVEAYIDRKNLDKFYRFEEFDTSEDDSEEILEEKAIKRCGQTNGVVVG